MTTGERMKIRRKEIRVTVEEIAAALGVSIATVYRYENGEIEKVPGDLLEPLSRVLQTTPAYLMGWEDSDASPDLSRFDSIFPIGEGSYIPLYGRIACGQPIVAIEELDEVVWKPEHVKADFGLTCCGHSMIGARILDGDIVYIRAQKEVQNGEIAAVVVRDEEVTLKRVYYYPELGVLSLRAENPNEPEQEYRGEELDHVRILGKAVHFLSKIK